MATDTSELSDLAVTDFDEIVGESVARTVCGQDIMTGREIEAHLALCSTCQQYNADMIEQGIGYGGRLGDYDGDG